MPRPYFVERKNGNSNGCGNVGTDLSDQES